MFNFFLAKNMNNSSLLERFLSHNPDSYSGIDYSKATVKLDNGILTVTIPKLENTKKRILKIN